MAEHWIITPTGGTPVVLPNTPIRSVARVVEVRTPPPAARVQWANRAEGAAPTVREHENREVTLKVELVRPADEWRSETHDFGTPPPEAEGHGDLVGWTGTVRRCGNGGRALEPAIRDLAQLVAALRDRGGTATRVLDSNAPITFDVLTAADPDGPTWDVVYYAAQVTAVQLVLTCAPFASGAELVVGTREKPATSRLLVVDGMQVPGDVPAQARIVLSGASADQQTVMVAVDQPDPATLSVGVEVESAVAPGGGTTSQQARSSANMPDALSLGIRRAPGTPTGTPAGLWEALSYLRTSGGAPLPVSGSYRVLVRLSAPTGTTLRLRWSAGSGAAGLSENATVAVDATAGAALVDLGTVTVPDGATLDGVLERLTPGTELYLDRWLLIPIDQYAVASANTTLGPLEITAVDPFARTGDLAGSTAPKGGTWSGRDPNGFTTDGSSAWRTANAGSGAAPGLPVATGPITVVASCRTMQACSSGERGVAIGNAAGLGALTAGTAQPPAGAWAVATCVEWDTVSPAGGERIRTTVIAGGNRTFHYHSAFREDWSGGHTFSLSVDGTTARMFMTWPGGSNLHLITIPALPANGLEAAIYTIGVLRRVNGADVAQRVDFDDYLVSAQPPPRDRALYAAPRTAQITSGASTREDQDARTGAIAQHLGDRPLLPPSGREARPVRVVAAVSRRDVRGGSDPSAGDTFTATVYATPRYLQIPSDS